MRTGPKYKIARRLGEKVFPKCQTTKFTVSGSGGRDKNKGKRKSPLSEYGKQLLEKQKAKYIYGVSERQFANYVKEARKSKEKSISEALYKNLERRLDNVVFRLGLAKSRAFARQMVSHGHITVNGKRMNVPSSTVSVGDIISIRTQSKTKGLFLDFEERTKSYTAPLWLSLDEKKMEGVVKELPLYGEMEFNLNFNSILEFYSRV